MKILIISLNNPNMYPALYYMACSFASRGHDVTFISKIEPKIDISAFGLGASPKWDPIQAVNRLGANLPFIRANYQGVAKAIIRLQPDWVIGQHQFALIALLSRVFLGGVRPKVAVYFSDYIENGWYMPLMKILASQMDAYIDVCEMRLLWRNAAWPNLRCPKFIIRQAPPISGKFSFVSRVGPPKVIFTGTDFGEGMQWDLLGKFINKLCDEGVIFHWFMPGSEDARSRAAGICSSERFSVFPPVDKSALAAIQLDYDVGFFWAPFNGDMNMPKKSFFVSAASNKIGEYHSAGLALLHTGNPGLAYLPKDVGIRFDPWRPVESAEKVAEVLLNRKQLDHIRAAAYQYHLDEMNAVAQVGEFIAHVEA